MDSIDSGASIIRDGEIRVTPIMSNYNQHGRPVHPIPSVYNGAQFGYRQQMEPNFVPPSGPVRAPLSQRRLLQRQQAQMARQREAQQRWLAEQQHRAYHQHQSPVVNGSDNMAAVAAAAAYRTAAAAAVAAAAATASAFLYPTTVYAMPSQQLILEPGTMMTQTTVAGTPFQLVQPQEVAVERVFAPAAAVAAQAALGTVLSRNGNGRTVVFRPQPSNTTAPSFAPYFLVDNNGHYHQGHYQQHHHHQPQQHHWQTQQWPPGAISLRQLVEFMDLPQGVTQQIIDKCSCIRAYQMPAKAVPVGEEDKCSVCLSEFEANENIRLLPCSHFFHVECIDRWLVCNKKCPVCRLHIDRHLHPTSTNH